MPYNRPIVLSIAGFDPTGGAGILADVKTCEQQACMGFSVLTANTIQTENVFESSNWIDSPTILRQLELLLSSYEIAFVKIGIVENLTILNEIILCLKKSNPKVYIVWDPIVSSSTGHLFLNVQDKTVLQKTLELVDLITPNTDEVKVLAQLENKMEAARYLAQFCSVYLKGGHSETEVGVDYLLESNRIHQFLPTSTNFKPKHGSGCILSSAITCNLAKEKKIIEACQEAKKYLEEILASNQNLLAYHHV